MNVGKTLFSQVMEFVPWKTFGRIIERRKGDAGVRTLGCADLFRVMAFSQLTWRESLRDIEACLAANQAKLFHMGLKVSPARSTLADALNLRDWRIYHALAQRLIVRAKVLYSKDPMGAGPRCQCLCVGLHHDRSLSEPVRLGAVSLDQGRGEDAHVAGSARHDPHVHSYQRWQAARCQRAGHPARGRRGLLCDGPGLCRLRASVRNASGRRLLRDPRQVADGRATRLLGDGRSNHWRDLRSARNAQWLLLGKEIPRTSATRSIQGLRIGKDADLPDQQHYAAGIDNCRPLQKQMARGVVFQMDQTASANQALPGHERERCKDANLVRRIDLRADCHRQEGAPPRCLALHMSTDPFGLHLREN